MAFVRPRARDPAELVYAEIRNITHRFFLLVLHDWYQYGVPDAHLASPVALHACVCVEIDLQIDLREQKRAKKTRYFTLTHASAPSSWPVRPARLNQSYLDLAISHVPQRDLSHGSPTMCC